MPTVLHVHAFADNYIWLVRDDVRPHVAIVDPGEAQPVTDFLRRKRLAPVAILCTHRHRDHVGGVAELRREYSIPVYGPDTSAIPEVTHPVGDGEHVALAGCGVTFRVLAIPGHTQDHIAYVGAGLLFCGDTLFSAGCGRLFDGTAEQLFASLQRLTELPAETKVYCGHEYTLANLRFALAVDPHHRATHAYRRLAERRLAKGQPTLPSTIRREIKINPFLRVGEPNVRLAIEARTGQPIPNDAAAFTALRRWKDDFLG